VAVPESFLATLPARLAEAVGANELETATSPPDGAGIRRSLQPAALRVDTRLVPGPLPRVTLALDQPVDAHRLCATWDVQRPVAVSPDVHQRTWSILQAGDELPDPHGRRIASDPIRAGRWQIVPVLTGRPPGALPDVVSGASPAYDIGERGGSIASIEIAPTVHEIRTLDPGEADALQLVAVMASRHPHWRGGWTPDPKSTFVAVYDDGEPVAGAPLTDAGATQICLARAGFGTALLDALEAVARDRGAARLRLDSSAFLPGDELPYARYGYTVGPPYDGDADVEVWAEKDLATPASAP
jgi:GNAT superfamily N-acetyltransferase